MERTFWVFHVRECIETATKNHLTIVVDLVEVAVNPTQLRITLFPGMA